MTNYYLGIDLGTSNSAVALFHNGKAEVIPNRHGDINIPSVVLVTPESIIVGEKAQKALYSDPANTFKEFKRLMGTGHTRQSACDSRSWSAEALSAELLKALKSRAEEHAGCTFDKVVVTVPALFELPQSKCTAEAARMAGFDQVELLPEPVASGLAAGWSSAEAGKAWLVYDLGGGTFDVSLLEMRDGLLRVIAHDGDNFLGGRDMDHRIVEWIRRQLPARINWNNKLDPEIIALNRHLETIAERAKICLSQAVHTVVEINAFWQGQPLQQSFTLSRESLNELIKPLVDKTLDVCRRLLSNHGLSYEHLSRVVMVGGPAHTPYIQQQVAAHLAPLAGINEDPMGLVTKGAALYAATINLACRSERSDPTDAIKKVWLQYPSVCSELNPSVMGRILDTTYPAKKIQLHSTDGHWSSTPAEVDESGIFILEAQVKAGKNNSFSLSAEDHKGKPLPAPCENINIVHGLSLSDPPLSRSIGVALADGTVKVYIQRGTPLPAKRTFMQSIVETLTPGSDQRLSIPIVQGERSQSRFCRRVGELVIDAKKLGDLLPAGAPVEITLAVDRGGDLKASALLTNEGITIEGVAQLFISEATADSIKASTQEISRRVYTQLKQAFRSRNEKYIQKLEPLAEEIRKIQNNFFELENDVDACQQTQRELMEIEAEIEHIEDLEALTELANECEERYLRTRSLVEEFGDDTDKRILENCTQQIHKALQNQHREEIERLIERLDTIKQCAHQKSPRFWVDVFTHWASYVHYARDPKKARKLVDTGNKAIADGQLNKLQVISQQLFTLIPERYRGHDNGGNDSGVY